jgi:hypothetical protein
MNEKFKIFMDYDWVFRDESINWGKEFKESLKHILEAAINHIGRYLFEDQQ